MAKRFHSALRNMTVVGANGRVLGELEDIEIDEQSWRMTNLIVRVRSDAVTELGLEKPFWSHARVAVPVDQVSGTSDVILLRASVEDMARMVAVADAEKDVEHPR